MLSSKFEVIQSLDLIAAELDYPMTSFTEQIVTSIRNYAESLQGPQVAQQDQREQSYTSAPMEFTDPKMKQRYYLFLGAFRHYI